MITAVELTLYDEVGNEAAVELSPMQVQTICKILMLSVRGGDIVAASDETLRQFWNMKGNPLRLQERPTRSGGGANG